MPSKSNQYFTWVGVLVLCVTQCGCGAQQSNLSKQDLESLLGKLDASVVVLGSKVVEIENILPAINTRQRTTGDSKGRLWIVTSSVPLPCPFPRDPKSISAMASDFDPKIRVEYDAFPVRIAYDIAAELRVSSTSLAMPKAGDLQSTKGRLSEWIANEATIRVRDFPTTTGWLSIVESFESAQ